MSYSISTLLTRNLHDVFGENDPERRRAAIDDIFTEDGVFYDPSKGVYRGRDEIDRVAGAIRATHPDFRYQPIAGPEELGNGGRIQWVSAGLVRRQLTPGLISSLPATRPRTMRYRTARVCDSERTVRFRRTAGRPSPSRSGVRH